MLPRGAILGGVAVAVAAFYCKLWKVQVLKEQDVLLQQLQQSYRPAQEPVLLMLGKLLPVKNPGITAICTTDFSNTSLLVLAAAGRGFFFVATAAWVVLSLQSLVAGVQRARYKPKGVPRCFVYWLLNSTAAVTVLLQQQAGPHSM